MSSIFISSLLRQDPSAKFFDFHYVEDLCLEHSSAVPRTSFFSCMFCLRYHQILTLLVIQLQYHLYTPSTCFYLNIRNSFKEHFPHFHLLSTVFQNFLVVFVHFHCGRLYIVFKTKFSLTTYQHNFCFCMNNCSQTINLKILNIFQQFH